MEYFKDDNIIFSLDIHDADIVLNSVFGNSIQTDAKKIFFTGESRKNGYTPDQILIGFDETNLNKKVFRFPLWYTYINWWPEKFYPEQIVGDPKYIVDINSLSKAPADKEINDFISRKMFGCMVVTNSTELRSMTYNSLSNIDRVDGYGAMFNNYYTGNKMDILKNYKFNVCFENTLSDGYVTEKLFEAKLAGCIPIYWGDSAAHNDFNSNGFIDFTRMSSLQELSDTVKSIYESEDRMIEIASQPMFNSPLSLDPLYDFFDKVGLK
jgi:hypothetical protein